MTTYDATIVADSKILADNPITQGQGRQLRDNLLAVIEGDSSAPSIARKAIAATGSSIDGAWINGTVLSGLGYFEPLSIVWSTSHSLPGVTVIRCSGGATISAVLTVAGVNDTDAAIAAFHLRARSGNRGANGSGANIPGGGGGHIGAGSAGNLGGAGGSAIPVTGVNRDWLALVPKIGGNGGNGDAGGAGGAGGGCLIFLIEGDLDMTGGTINADGTDGTVGAADNGGGGAGGTIIILCTGTLTGGTYTARGGNGATGGGHAHAGNGGGGRVVLVAKTFAGSRTKTVTAGTLGNGTAGDGQADEVTLTAPQIRALLFRSY